MNRCGTARGRTAVGVHGITPPDPLRAGNCKSNIYIQTMRQNVLEPLKLNHLGINGMLIFVLWTCGFLLKTACSSFEMLHRIHLRLPSAATGVLFLNMLFVVQLCKIMFPDVTL
jgi:hypothetical protein